jgi:hypothetical protein
MPKPIGKSVSSEPESSNRRPAHQCAAASYYTGPFGQEPMLICTCGKSFPQDTWEAAGRLFDAHLTTTKRKRKP